MPNLRLHLSAPAFLALVLLLTPAIVAALCALPHDRHVRFTSLDDPTVAKVGWIYERIHDDPAPTDIVFVGSSHTVFGVDAPRVTRRLQEAGRDLHAVNFGLQHLGRDLPYLLAREALLTRPVRLLVIEVQEDESRSLHPAFGALADVSDVLSAPIFVNTSLAADLAQLPLRQLRLFARSALQHRAGPPPRQFPGSDWNDTYSEGLRHGAPRTAIHGVAELEAQRQHFAALVAGKFTLPAPLAWLETRANLVYLDRLVALAKERRVPVRFLYMPDWHTTAPPRFAAIYAAGGPTWFPTEAYAPSDRWLDVNHLNTFGAAALSDWLATTIAADPALAQTVGSGR